MCAVNKEVNSERQTIVQPEFKFNRQASQIRSIKLHEASLHDGFS